MIDYSKRMLMVLSAVIAAIAAAAVPASALANGSATRTVTQDGLTITLTATPADATSGQPVRFVARALTEHASGALVYGLAYGDGTTSRPVAVPQYCLAGAGRPATGVWRFTHRYHAAGRYQVALDVGVNCGGEHASVRIVVNITAASGATTTG